VEHCAFEHVPPLHDVPHAPQWAALVARFVSHPSAALPLQSPQPEAQA
jgi:hypothetical protein